MALYRRPNGGPEGCVSVYAIRDVSEPSDMSRNCVYVPKNAQYPTLDSARSAALAAACLVCATCRSKGLRQPLAEDVHSEEAVVQTPAQSGRPAAIHA